MAAVVLTSGPVTHRIHRVQERGWVRRDRDPDNRRSVMVSLTETGRQRALDVLTVKTHVETSVLDVLGDDPIDTINDALRRVRRPPAKPTGSNPGLTTPSHQDTIDYRTGTGRRSATRAPARRGSASAAHAYTGRPPPTA
jgi:hypothetical protein